MASRRCWVCGRPLASSARRCPSCGMDQARSGVARLVALVMFGVIAVVLIVLVVRALLLG